MKIRPIVSGEYIFLDDFLYDAIFIPEGVTPPEKSIIQQPELQKANYLKADATIPQTEGNIIISHICNDIWAWGKGFVLAISKRWKEPAKQYKQWYKEGEGFILEAVQFVAVEENVWVANIIGQHKIYKDENGNPPIRYEAVKEGLQQVAEFAKK